jgi:hypothetical protein
VKIWMRSLFAIAMFAVGVTQLSCSVNDYCLNCENGDAGGSGNGDADDGGGGGSDASDAGCIPTGPEECDGKDNNCNGLTDEEPITGVGVLCANQSGACSGGVTVCTNGQIKCDKLGSPETCNGFDDNCSGAADEGDPGGGAKCGTEAGDCVAGYFHCTAGSVQCIGFIDHTGDPELCDARDNDCDGKFDENIVITPSGCGPTTNNGECNIGTLQCQAGSQICTGAVFPKFETCNSKDDDCDTNIDEIFNKQTDIQNCGACNNVCQPTSKTCINATNPMVNGTACTIDSQCPGGTCATNSQPRCVSGGCTFACNAGFRNKDLQAANGCEFFCFATGAEECDGIDNDCDGNTDEGLTPPPLCLGGGECGATAPTAVCTGPGGWTCSYGTGVTQFPETLCDNKDNDCDGNVDEAQKNLGGGVSLGATCSVVPETSCNDSLDNDNDGFTNDGCPSVGAAETACNDTVDSDNDMVVNDGCPAHEERGICKSTGTYTCDGANLNGPPKCTITMPGVTPDANETCDAKDNDCDGKTDEGGATGALIGQDWVDLGGGRQMMKYEASKPDATPTSQGTAKASDATDTSAFTCSRAGVQPWTNLKYTDAVAACAKVGATLCSEVQWHRACSAVTSVTYPVAAPGTGTFIEAEDYQSTAFAGQYSWVEDYTGTFSGIAGVEATPNLGASVTAANAPTQSPHVDFQVNFGATSSTWHVWVKVFANSAANDAVLVGVGSATPATTTTFPSGNFNTWQWVDALLPASVSGIQTVRVYMGDDGVKIDKIYIFNGTTTAATIAAADTLGGKGGKWAYASSATTYNATTCNGDDYDTNTNLAGDQDDILTTGALTNCKSTMGGGIFDLSGNVKEWTLAHVPGENPIRGGASNNTGEGTSCPLNFTLADDSFFFPNIGFRCCR